MKKIVECIKYIDTWNIRKDIYLRFDASHMSEDDIQQMIYDYRKQDIRIKRLYDTPKEYGFFKG